MARTYTTIQGDTWDLIAYKTLGAEHYMKEFIEANPQYIHVFSFSAGVVLTIPEITEEEDESLLPVWRTGAFDSDGADEDDLYDPEWPDIDEESGDDEEDE
jgi:phage tail protein X